MIDLNGKGLALAQLTLIALAGPAFAQGATAIADAAQSTEYGSGVNQNHVPTATLVPEDFDVPTLVETSDFKIVPLSPAITKIDFAAYMSSIKHLQETFTRSTDWPHEGISDADALRDMEAEQARFRSRTSFAYAVLTPDGSRERGCVYIYPSDVEGYDATVRIWVTKSEYDAGFDAELYQWVTDWIRRDWPFVKVAYPGRAIGWRSWDALVAANKARIAGAERQQR